MPKTHQCSTCTLRKKYDDNPRSVVGRLWRWHIRWCPGWRAYITGCTPEERKTLAETYGLQKYL